MITRITPSKKSYTSILPDHPSEIPEIQGYYWPRVLRDRQLPRDGKRGEKKATKALRRKNKPDSPRRCESYMQAVEFPVSKPFSDFHYSPCEIPSLIGEDQLFKAKQPHFSPVTGKRVVFIEKNESRLVPPKLLRKHRHSHGRSLLPLLLKPTLRTGWSESNDKIWLSWDNASRGALFIFAIWFFYIGIYQMGVSSQRTLHKGCCTPSSSSRMPRERSAVLWFAPYASS